MSRLAVQQLLTAGGESVERQGRIVLSFLGICRRLVTSINRDKRGSNGSYCLENAFQETWFGDESDKSLR